MNNIGRARRYIGLIDGEAGAYGIVFPDLPGCTAMGRTLEEVMINSADAMRDWIEVAEEQAGRTGVGVGHPSSIEALRRDPDVVAALREGATAVAVPLVRTSGRAAKANISIDDEILAAIDAEAERRKLTRSAFIEVMAREMIPRLAR